MNNGKLVSIAMTTYNGEKFLREQLDSIYNQTYKNIEVVVCDDCSTDSTIKILDEYKHKYSLKYYVNEKNLGYKKNFEKVASLCNGEFIAFSDQDDIWLIEKIETLVNEINEFSLVYTDAELIDKDGLSLGETKKERFKRMFNINPANNFDEIFSIGLQGCTALVKKDIVLKAIPFKNKMPHDLWVGLVASRVDGVKYVDKCLIKYRLHCDNACGIDKKGFHFSRLKRLLKKTLPPVYFILRYIYKKIKLKMILQIFKERNI